jgi:hypothetical protein
MSPVVLRVYNAGSATVNYTVSRPTDQSLTTLALNQAVPANFDSTHAALLVPGASVAAESTAPVVLGLSFLLEQSTWAYGAKVLATWADGYLKRVQYTPSQRLFQQMTTCVRDAYGVFRAYVSHNNENAIIQAAASYLSCRSLFQSVRKIVNEPPVEAEATANELAKIGKVARTTLVEDAFRLGARAAAVLSRAR